MPHKSLELLIGKEKYRDERTDHALEAVWDWILVHQAPAVPGDLREGERSALLSAQHLLLTLLPRNNRCPALQLDFASEFFLLKILRDLQVSTIFLMAKISMVVCLAKRRTCPTISVAIWSDAIQALGFLSPGSSQFWQLHCRTDPDTPSLSQQFGCYSQDRTLKGREWKILNHDNRETEHRDCELQQRQAGLQAPALLTKKMCTLHVCICMYTHTGKAISKQDDSRALKDTTVDRLIQASNRTI